MTNLEKLRKEREKWLEWKNIAPLRQKLQNLPKLDAKLACKDTISLEADVNASEMSKINELALELKSWRKGPFDVFGTFIDSEWQSFIKYNLLESHFDLQDKIVGDIGCNNGYYLFRMLTQKPKKLIGFDPSPLYKTQFDFINFYAKTDITYELLGVEHLPIYDTKFDTLFCLGVLYHRHNPIETLKHLQKSLHVNGELILDTFYICGDSEMVLSPNKTYSKIPNVHFVPTIKALQNWCEKAGFDEFEVLETKKTDSNEQRKTSWINSQSLEDFLDPKNPNLTIEGYEAPQRVYVKVKKTR
ncbi:MAG: tRNA 5-methoxyuridine(34)/uridine 5-oxyacetic acid(34) synthase CmoB [Campylobacteraceae bacterium]|nr:tRNA 5-methoxyuridine(34)/uridine 5-oxyacetic acid(34) synthase CmoB [Campylobacteraceae bacterium]